MARAARPWLNVSGWRRLPVIRQATVTECGLACVAMVASYFGHALDLATLRRRFGASLHGTSLASLIHVSESLRLSTRAVRCDLPELARLRKPCILHWQFDHFVVLEKVAGKHLHLHDPARGMVRMSFDEVGEKFTGVALELSPADNFRKCRPVRSLSLTDLVVVDRAFTSSVSVALLLALVSELLLLAMPFYLQTVIDQVLMRGDDRLLNTLVLGFAGLTAFQLLASGLRQLTFQFLSQTTVFNLSSRVLRHLLHLPVAWFRARRLGDIQQRMLSLAHLQAFITQSAPALVLDSIFLLIVVVFMTAYAPVLTAIVAAASGMYVLWRLLAYPTMLEQANKLVRTEAAAQTHLLESLRSIQSIKSSAGETYRGADWQNLFVRRLNAQIRAGNLGIVDNSVSQAIFQGLHIGIVFLLAKQVQGGDMSIGTVSAFIAYTGMFVKRAGGIINRVFEYKLLQVPLDRLADVVFNEPERCGRQAAGMQEDDRARLAGGLRVSDMTFAYSKSDKPMLEHVSFEVTGGEFVAIRGLSGSGKSTLLRLLAGLERPVSGSMHYDGKPASDWPLAVIRRGIATVFHDDVLVSGSIAENIALFDRDRDDQRIREVAELAAVGASIERLPMAYDTPIGDLGSALSAGQVQRMLLARALYRRASILLLDEFTSCLDEDTERRVVNALAGLQITRIVASHSATVLRAADRVLELRGGRLLPL